MRSLLFGWTALILGGLAGCTEAARPPRFVFDTDPVDLGVLEPGESEFKIAFGNGGTAPLRVAKVESTCACTRADATPEVGPAGSGEVRGRVKVQAGPGGAKLTLTSNDPAGPREVQVKWFGNTPPTLVPGALDLAMRVGQAASREIELSYPTGDPPVAIEFVGASGLPDGATVSLIADNPAAIKATPGLGASFKVAPSSLVGRATFRVDLPAPTKPGTAAAEGRLTFRRRGHAVEVPLRLTTRVDEGVRAAPEQILLGARGFEELRQIKRKVVATSDAPRDPFRVVAKPDFLAVEVEHRALEPATRAVVTATVVAPPAAGAAKPQLILEDAAGRRLVIPIYLEDGS